MKFSSHIASVLLIFITACTPEIRNEEKTNHSDIDAAANVYFTEEVAILLEESIQTDGVVTKSDELNSFLESSGITSAVRLFPHAGEYEPRTRKEGLHRWYKITYTAAPTKAQEMIMTIPGVEIFEPVRKVEFHSLFNDPGMPKQWHYRNDGSLSTEFKAGADINVLPVWENYTTGDRSVIVAVVDQGVDHAHEDIGSNYVDGKNFGTGGKVTADDHGTHVAGTIAAVNNNGKGVCGIAGGNAAEGIDGVGILSCQIFSGNHPVGGAEAIKWAADNGAVIANNSWGYVYDSESDAKKDNIPSDLAAAIDYFIKYAGCDNEGNQLPDSPMKGGIVLFSAGNDGWRYNPIGEYDPVIAVGAIGPDYNRAYYSCYGDWVDIAAPGGDYNINKGQVYSTLPDNSYDYMQGTSMSCPHVSGVAALIASYFGGPGFSNDMLKERLLGGARDILPASAKIGPLVDALGSFTMGGTIAPDKVEEYELEAVGNRVRLQIKVTADKDDAKAFEYVVYASENEEAVRNLVRDAVPDDVYEYRFKVGSTEIGEYMRIHIDNLEFEKEYFFTIIGCDYSQNYSEASEVKSVRTVSNNAPVIIPQQEEMNHTIRSFENLTLSFMIYDPEAGETQVKIADAQNGLTLRKKGEDIWDILITGNISTPGQHDCVLVATDMQGLSTEFRFSYCILENTAPALIRNFDDIYIEGKGGTFTYDLTEYFTDIDGENLTYRISEGNRGVAGCALSGSLLTVTIVGYGTSSLTVTAEDLKTKCSAELRIGAKNPENHVEMYPVPVINILNIRTGEKKETEVQISSASGYILYEGKDYASIFEPMVLDLSDFAPGRYRVKVSIGEHITEKVINKI